MNILGLDLGTTTGWACSSNGEITLGSWKLATPKEITAQRRIGDDRNADIRIPRLFLHIANKVYIRQIDAIVFEDVKFIKTTMQGQLWAAFRSCIWLQPKPEKLAVPVQTLKKFATGWHNATKEQMIEAAFKHHPTLCENVKKFDDNMADALHCLLYGIHELKQ